MFSSKSKRVDSRQQPVSAGQRASSKMMRDLGFTSRWCWPSWFLCPPGLACDTCTAANKGCWISPLISVENEDADASRGDGKDAFVWTRIMCHECDPDCTPTAKAECSHTANAVRYTIDWDKADRKKRLVEIEWTPRLVTAVSSAAIEAATASTEASHPPRLAETSHPSGASAEASTSPATASVASIGATDQPPTEATVMPSKGAPAKRAKGTTEKPKAKGASAEPKGPPAPSSSGATEESNCSNASSAVQPSTSSRTPASKAPVAKTKSTALAKSKAPVAGSTPSVPRTKMSVSKSKTTVSKNKASATGSTAPVAQSKAAAKNKVPAKDKAPLRQSQLPYVPVTASKGENEDSGRRSSEGERGTDMSGLLHDASIVRRLEKIAYNLLSSGSSAITVPIVPLDPPTAPQRKRLRPDDDVTAHRRAGRQRTDTMRVRTAQTQTQTQPESEPGPSKRPRITHQATANVDALEHSYIQHEAIAVDQNSGMADTAPPYFEVDDVDFHDVQPDAVQPNTAESVGTQMEIEVKKEPVDPERLRAYLAQLEDGIIRHEIVQEYCELLARNDSRFAYFPPSHLSMTEKPAWTMNMAKAAQIQFPADLPRLIVHFVIVAPARTWWVVVMWPEKQELIACGPDEEGDEIARETSNKTIAMFNNHWPAQTWRTTKVKLRDSSLGASASFGNHGIRCLTFARVAFSRWLPMEHLSEIKLPDEVGRRLAVELAEGVLNDFRAYAVGEERN